MKKIMTLVAILGFGMMVGCGEEAKKTTGSGTTKSTTVSTSTKDTATPAATLPRNSFV